MNRLKWTYEACKEAALECKTKTDFIRIYGGAYQSARNNSWIDDICSHMLPIGNKYRRCVYAYEFPDNHAYVGLTCNLDNRHQNHTSSNSTADSAVRDHMLKTGLTPRLVQLTGYIHYLTAAKEERNWENKYESSGFTMLNRMATGSLTLRNTFYTKEKCKEILLSLGCTKDVYEKHPALLTKCRKHGWHSSIIKKLNGSKRPNNYWTKERCAKLAKSVSSVSELIQKNKTVYRIIWQNKWSDELTSHLERTIKPKGYWNKALCKEASLKAKSKYDFLKKFPSAHDASKRNGWLNEFFPKRAKRLPHSEETKKKMRDAWKVRRANDKTNLYRP